MPKYLIRYTKFLSTVNQEAQTDGLAERELHALPTREDIVRITSELEDDFFRKHRGRLRNLMSLRIRVDSLTLVSARQP
jgi:hypothetical protein